MTDIARKYAHSFIDETHEFNYSCIIVYNADDHKLTHWAGGSHGEKWTQKDCQQLAYRMFEYAAEQRKADFENPNSHTFNFAPRRKIVFQGGPLKEFMLGAIGVSWPNPAKRLWLTLYVATTEFGLSVRWYEGVTGDGRPYWSGQLLVGPFELRLSRDK